MLEILIQPSNLVQKAKIISKLFEIGPNIEMLVRRICLWKVVYNCVESNQILCELSKLSLMMFNEMNKKNARGFQLEGLLKLFDLKSAQKRSRSAYHILAKFWLKSKNLSWANLPNELMPETVAAEIKNLQPLPMVVELS